MRFSNQLEHASKLIFHFHSVMINAIIIDDEADAREALKMAIVKFCPDVDVKASYGIPEEGIAGLRQLQPDLVFLDVQMPHLSGFDVLQRLWPPSFDVIFVSAYDQYAIKAIRFSAIDYLLKPVDVDDLLAAIKRVRERISQKSKLFQYESVLHNIRNGPEKIQRIAVPSAEGIDFFNVDDIVYCIAEGSYTTVVLRGKQNKLVSKNLKDFETLLSDSGFCRVHHSYLINLAHVQKYIKGEGGYVQLTDGHTVDISRRKKEEFLSLLNKI